MKGENTLLLRRAPVWFIVSVTAFITVIIMLLLNHFTYRDTIKDIAEQRKNEKTVYNVAPYQDNTDLVFAAPKGDTPGIGFFGDARKRIEPFDGLKIQMQDNRHIFLKWSEIKTARLYEALVYSVNDKGRTIVGKTPPTGNTEVVLQVSGIMPGKRYEWELIGQTDNGGSFFSRGGFVVGVEVRF